ncbi:MAG: hypothetical protein CFH44_00870 [Proteobacteria bacterium]|nr:MAG: hypothetical protein CFH44_00870 [Pseudomonadota bacterium]|tara:strand:- start:655 stop:828 length:174 start_codon:yes stop_codon:yes gene_type:complete
MTEINLHEELKEIRKEIKNLKLEITQYKSFVGGVLWAFMALSAAVTFLYEWIKEVLK